MRCYDADVSRMIICNIVAMIIRSANLHISVRNVAETTARRDYPAYSRTTRGLPSSSTLHHLHVGFREAGDPTATLNHIIFRVTYNS